MSAFERALAFTLAREGGYSDNPADPGGRTNHGIAETYHPEAWADGKVTKEEAAAIYRHDYWEAVRCDDVPELVAVALFDCAVNPGVSQAVKFLQVAVGAEVDGRFGVQTVVKLRLQVPREIALRIADVRSGYWIARARGEQAVFLKGWMRRSQLLREELLR